MPDISKIQLPSGNIYDIKDQTARDMISGGVSFNIAWDGSSAPDVTTIPAGVKVYYNDTEYVGTMAAADATPGSFYLVKSSTQTAGGPTDTYDEYVVVGPAESKSWEKIGDTQVDLSDVVTSVTLNKNTTNFVTGYSAPTSDSVIGADATFSVTQPTINVTPNTTYLGATASGTAVGADGTAAAITALGTPTTDTFVKSVTAETNKNLVTASVTGVQATTTTASKATAATSQTTANGSGTASTANTDWLKGASVTNEVLIIGAATMNTQTTTQFTFNDVTVPIKDAAATTVATGATSTTGTGDAVVTGVTIGSSAAAITALGTPTTSTVLTGVKVTAQPTVNLASNTATATGRVQVATGISSATATGGNVAWGSKDATTVLTGLGTATTAAGLNSSTSIVVGYGEGATNASGNGF